MSYNRGAPQSDLYGGAANFGSGENRDRGDGANGRGRDRHQEERDEQREDRRDELEGINRQLEGMNVGGQERQENMYSQNPKPRSRVVRRIEDPARRGDFAGSAQYPHMPVPKQNLIHTTQTFTERPKEWVSDKKLGKKTELWTNHVLVHLPQQTIKLYCYNIDIYKNNKAVTKREEASPIFYDIIRNNRRHFPKPSIYIFNDVNMMWSTEPLPFAQGIVNNRRLKLDFKFTGQVDFGQTIRSDQDQQLLSTLVDAIATARVRYGCPQYVVFKQCMFMLREVGEATHIPNEMIDVKLRHGMDSRVGVSIGIRVNLRAGITACFDLAHTMFTRPGYPLIRLLCELINVQPIPDDQFRTHWKKTLKSTSITQNNRLMMDSILKNMKLQYSSSFGVRINEDGVEAVRNISEKKFKYHGLTEGSASNISFTDQEGRDWTIAQFFQQVHKITLQFPNLPCLIKKSSSRFVAYPMELVSYIGEAKRFEGFSTELLKGDLIKGTAYSAPQRRRLLQHIIGQNRFGDVPPVINNEDSHMRRHGLTLGKEMLSVKATVLPPPTVVYGEGSQFLDTNRMGEWDAVSNNPIRKVLEKSVFLRDTDKNAPLLKKRLLGSILHVGSPINGTAQLEYDPACYYRLMRAIDSCGQPVAWEHEDQRIAAVQGTFEYCQGVNHPNDILDFFQTLKSNIDEKYKKADDEVLIPFVLIVFGVRFTTLKNNRYGIVNDYNLIKHYADNEIGIYTQGILFNNLNTIAEHPAACKLTSPLIEKILGKVGTTHRKLERDGRHQPWTLLTDPKNPTLILGVDVSHPSVGDRKEKDIRKLSVASIVGNIDTDCTEYRSSSRIQDMGEEKLIYFKHEMNERINDFIRSTGTHPAHIVIYRDGICETDFQRHLYEDRINIENCCLEIDPEFKPTLTYIVATKRHHTRFFLKDDSEGHEKQNFNVLPGTLVEDVVTSDKYYDFFLTTQVGETGLARPTHYYVLYNTWDTVTSFWPAVTHALTYMFCRTTSTVALPAPLLYAHLAAKRAKECLDGAWNDAAYQRKRISVDNVADLIALTKAINVNQSLDGMTFV